MKFSFGNLGGRIRGWIAKIRIGRSRSQGIAAIPGQTLTFSAGKLRIPVIDWEKLYRKSFLYNSIAAVICGYFVADLLVAGITPWMPPAQAPRPRMITGDHKDFFFYANAILPRGRPNLFSEKGLVPDNDEGGGGGDGPPVKTNLPLNLMGVIVLENEKKSVASVEDKTANLVVAVRIGENITRDTLVEKITEDRVIFFNQSQNRREYIELPKDQILATRRAAPAKGAGGIQKTGETHYNIDRKEIDKAMMDMNTILQDARCVPELKGGRPAGYRCFQITPGSIYDKLGLKDGDIVVGINGENVNDPTRVFTMLNSLKDPSTRSISFTIDRNGSVSTYQYDIN
ncbi:MAG TPA: hypothetical protein VIH99_05485 [Bdellovibrionota bacterium]|jgi:type II secretion system protein C